MRGSHPASDASALLGRGQYPHRARWAARGPHAAREARVPDGRTLHGNRSGVCKASTPILIARALSKNGPALERSNPWAGPLPCGEGRIDLRSAGGCSIGRARSKAQGFSNRRRDVRLLAIVRTLLGRMACAETFMRRALEAEAHQRVPDRTNLIKACRSVLRQIQTE